MITVTVQAFRGQALIHPDGRTLGLLAGFTAITLAALGAVITTARRQAAVPLETAGQLAGRV